MIAVMEGNDVATVQPEDEGIGPLIQRLRLAIGWSQDTLAERVGMSRAYLSQIESSKTKWPAKYVAALARELGVRPSVLGRAAGRIIRDADYPYTPVLRPGEAGVTIGGSANLVTSDDDDPWLRIVQEEARDLSPSGRRALVAHLRTMKEWEDHYRAEALREAAARLVAHEVFAEESEEERERRTFDILRRASEDPADTTDETKEA